MLNGYDILMYYNLARHTGHLLQDSASLLHPQGGERSLTGVGATVAHGGKVLNTAARMVENGGELIQTDRTFIHSATSSLFCLVLCPLRRGSQQATCRRQHCDSKVRIKEHNQEQRKPRNLEIRHENSAVKERIDDDVAHGILDMGAQILSGNIHNS